MLRPPPLALLAGILVVGLAGCDSGQQAPSSTTSAALAPLDPTLQKTYDTTCKTCHEEPTSGAPQAGNGAWSAIAAKGKGVVLDHVFNGYNKMPPMGMCMHCTEADFIALTEHMAGAVLR